MMALICYLGLISWAICNGFGVGDATIVQVTEKPTVLPSNCAKIQNSTGFRLYPKCPAPTTKAPDLRRNVEIFDDVPLCNFQGLVNAYMSYTQQPVTEYSQITRTPTNGNALTRIIVRRNGNGGYSYPYYLEAEITPNTINNPRIEVTQSQRNALINNMGYVQGQDDAGHLLAASLGGPTDLTNLVSMSTSLNRGMQSIWRTFERHFRNYLRTPGRRIVWRLAVVYGVTSNLSSPHTMRPLGFYLQYSVFQNTARIYESVPEYLTNNPHFICNIGILDPFN